MHVPEADQDSKENGKDRKTGILRLPKSQNHHPADKEAEGLQNRQRGMERNQQKSSGEGSGRKAKKI